MLDRSERLGAIEAIAGDAFAWIEALRRSKPAILTKSAKPTGSDGGGNGSGNSCRWERGCVMIVKPEDVAAFHRETLAAIRGRTTEMVERTVAEAQTFAASPAYENVMREIVAKASRLGYC